MLIFKGGDAGGKEQPVSKTSAYACFRQRRVVVVAKNNCLLRTEPQLRGSRGEERGLVRVSAEAVRKSYR